MGKSIFIEGMDGSGKSSQVELLKEYLEVKGISVLALREPGGSDYYEALRTVHFSSELKRPAISDALLSGAGRAANIQQTKEALAKDMWVLSDRAYPSTYAYQVAQGVDWEVVDAVNKLALGGFNYDIKILIDVPVEIARSRVEKTGSKKDHWESRGDQFFNEIRRNYLKLAQKEGHIILNGETAIEETHKLIVSLLEL